MDRCCGAHLSETRRESPAAARELESITVYAASAANFIRRIAGVRYVATGSVGAIGAACAYRIQGGRAHARGHRP